eukprot:SAG11_NODE_22369_length_407_cov_0.902597_2_plen_28_part_01
MPKLLTDAKRDAKMSGVSMKTSMITMEF